MRPVALSPQARDAALAALAATELDVLVVGGGVVGAGCALDAATRGLSVGLVEARDFASGTSSRSSKLVHGGLRYLEMLDVRLVAEALAERGLLIDRLAPHLVRPVPFVYPLRHRGWERLYVGAGVLLYDTLGLLSGRARGLPRHRHLTRRGARRIVPALRRDALVGALQYHDAQVDDARHTMFLARTAAAYGAHVASRARVVGLLREGGRIVGAQVRDLEAARTLSIRARQVVTATGVWTDETRALAGERGPSQVRVSKGAHLVVPREKIRSGSGLILRTATSVLFVIPWGGHWIIGTTDTEWRRGPTSPTVDAGDVDYLLGRVNEVLEQPLTRADVEGAYAGLRPLLAGESETTSRLSREHAVARPVPGLVVVAGGKYTTYRVMARDAIDEAVRGLAAQVPPSVTEDVPLLGAEGFVALRNARPVLAARSGLPEERIEHLLGRYGTLVHEVLDLVARDPALGEPLRGAPQYLRAEVVYAVSHEGALHLDDVLARRTRVSIETPDRGVGASEEIARLMAPVLGWGAEQAAREVERYRSRAEAELASQLDDEMAGSPTGAPQVVALR